MQLFQQLFIQISKEYGGLSPLMKINFNPLFPPSQQRKNTMIIHVEISKELFISSASFCVSFGSVAPIPPIAKSSS